MADDSLEAVTQSESRSLPEAHHYLGRRDGEALAGPDENRHTSPAPGVAVQADRDEGLRVGISGDTSDLPIAVVLTSDDVIRRQRPDRTEDVKSTVTDGVIAGARGLHEHQRQDLQQVVLHDVTKGPDPVVEGPAIFYAKALGHRDLNGLDVLTAPQRLEPGIGESHEFDVLDRLLAQVVVYAQQLVLAEHLVQSIIQLDRRVQARAEGLLDGDPTVAREVGSAELLNHGAEERRRDLEIEERAADALHVGRQPGVEARIREVAAEIGHALRQTGQNSLVDDLPRGRHHRMDRIARHGPKVLITHVIAGDADHGHREEPPLLQVIERRKRHLVGEVAGDPEDHQRVRGLLGWRVGHGFS